MEYLLKTCGLNATEQQVFECLLKRGKSLASVIAKSAHLKRPTVYAALSNLQQYGLVLSQKTKGGTYFSLIDLHQIPQVLDDAAEQKYNEVRRAAQLLGHQLNRIKSDHPIELGGFDVTQIETIEGVYAQLEEALMGGEFSSVFNPQLALSSDRARKIVKRFLDNTAKTKPHIREFVVPGPLADWYKSQVKNPNEQIKELPLDSPFNSDMIFVNQSVFIMHYQPDQPVAIRMRHPEFYQSMMTLFDLLWEKY